MDNPKKRGKPDRIRISVRQRHEVRYWTKRLGIARDRLVAAVKSAGPMVKNVKRWLIARIRKA